MVFLIGKPIGVLGFTYLACKLKLLKKPDDIAWTEVLGVGFLAGVGFTMSIFISHLAFADEATIAAAKLSIFAASFVAAVIGVILILSAKKVKA